MRKTMVIAAAAMALVPSTPALAQAWIGQFAGDLMTPRAAPDSCYAENYQAKAKDYEIARKYSEVAINRYLGLANAGQDVSKAFMGWIGGRKQRHWYLDGVETDTKLARDPWAGRVARVEPVATVIGNQRIFWRVRWKALASDGTVLGIYDGHMQPTIKGAQFYHLSLFSAGATLKPEEMKPFCAVPGDIEKWREAKAEREARKAARAAAGN